MIKLSEDLRRWFKEKWTAQDGSECGDYKGRGRVKCRPSRRVSDESPETWSEMSPKEKKKAVRLKQKAHREGKQFSSHKSGKTWDGKKNKYRPKNKTKMNESLINEDDMAQDRGESVQNYRARLLRQIANGNISDMDNHDRVHGALAYIDAIRGQYEGSARNINVVVAGRGEQGSAKIGFVLHGINPKGTHIVAQPAAKGAARHPRHEEVPIKNIYGLQLSSYPNLRPEHRETLRRLMDFRRLTEMFEPLKQLLAEAKKEKKPYKGFKKGKNHPEGGLSRAEARRQGIHAGIETKQEAKRKGGFGKLSGKTQKRRKSFCARMCGMKRRRTSAKTARDPKSKINAALRVWGCKCGGKSRKQIKEEFIGMILEKKGSCWSGYKQEGMKKKGGKMVPNCVPTNESVQLNEGKNKPKNKKLWAKAKALARQKFDVYPSAYANGWAAKWYKKKGGTWVSENLNYIQQSVKEKFLAEGCGCGGGNKPKPKPRPVQKPKGNDLNEEVRNEAHRGKMSRKMIRSRDARAKRLKGVAKVVVKGDTPLNAQHRLATYIEWKMKKGKKKKGDAD